MCLHPLIPNLQYSLRDLNIRLDYIIFVKNYNQRIKENIKIIKKLPKIKGINEIMYPGQSKYIRFKKNSKRAINISKIIQRDLKTLSLEKN